MKKKYKAPKSYGVTGCQEDFSAMARVPGGLYCGRCDHKVHDLTRATKSEADALMEKHKGDLCIMIRAGADGRAKFRPEPKKMSGFVLLSALTASACASDTSAQRTHQTQTQQVPQGPRILNAHEYAAQAAAKQEAVAAALAETSETSEPPDGPVEYVLGGAPVAHPAR